MHLSIFYILTLVSSFGSMFFTVNIYILLFNIEDHILNQEIHEQGSDLSVCVSNPRYLDEPFFSGQKWLIHNEYFSIFNSAPLICCCELITVKMEMLTFAVCQCHQTFEQFRFLALLSGGCFETLHLTFLTCVAKLDKVEQLRKLSKKRKSC